jgi:putative protease
MNSPVCSGSPDSLEILAPAGSPEALTAAIRGGADAVYLGAGSFNARRNAHNFDAAALREAAALCHSHGVKLYLTLNTLIRQDELSAALALAEQACLIGLDALIIQDTGLAAKIRAAAPQMPLHASTQLSCHTPAGVRALHEMGFSRVVLAREMSRDEIAACAGLGAELEVFVHGALCMSVSGQCYLSAMLGGRSGNRGLCAQPCRLPFTVKQNGDADDRALSLRDLSLYDYVSDMASRGVCSLKIEGRMKRPEYVAAAARCFSEARDALYSGGNGADPALLEDLQSVFSRSGFTSGYYTARRDSAMFGSRTREDVTAAAPALGRLARLYDKEVPRVPVGLTFTMRAGASVSLTAADGNGNVVTVTGDAPQTAVKLPLDAQRATAQLAKTGGTPFTAAVTCRLEDGLTLPLSSLNALRREALDKLSEQRGKTAPVPFDSAQEPPKVEAKPLALLNRSEKPRIAARFANAGQVPENADADLVIVPLDTPLDTLSQLMNKYALGVEIPRGLFGTEQSTARKLAAAADAGIKIALCGSIGAIPLTRDAGLIPVAGFGMNLTNRHALDAMISQGVSAAVLSQELTFSQMRFAAECKIPCGIIAYGRQPLMLMRNCPGKLESGCKACGGKGGLTDRRGTRFPLACAGGCAELLNSVPLWLADKLPELPPLDFLLLHFTDETPEQATGIISAYRTGGAPPKEFTRGLYKRGVE